MSGLRYWQLANGAQWPHLWLLYQGPALLSRSLSILSTVWPSWLSARRVKDEGTTRNVGCSLGRLWNFQHPQVDGHAAGPIPDLCSQLAVINSIWGQQPMSLRANGKISNSHSPFKHLRGPSSLQNLSNNVSKPIWASMPYPCLCLIHTFYLMAKSLSATNMASFHLDIKWNYGMILMNTVALIGKCSPDQ